MPFDQYIRSLSVMAIIGAAALYLVILSSRCDGPLIAMLLAFIQVPVLVCALVAPLVWRLAQSRPIERRTFVFAGWAAAATALEVTIAVTSPGTGCFR